jgi:hypothetical protein
MCVAEKRKRMRDGGEIIDDRRARDANLLCERARPKDPRIIGKL